MAKSSIETTAKDSLATRVRLLLADTPSVREVSMFGGLAFMVSEKMAFSVLKDGDLLLRVDDENGPHLCVDSEAFPAEMGEGRAMGPGWIHVPAKAISLEEELSHWLRIALEYNSRSQGGNG